MNDNIKRATLGRALIESTVGGNDGFFAKRFTTQLLCDYTAPHDTVTFELTLPDGITVIQVTAVVTVTAPAEPA